MEIPTKRPPLKKISDVVWEISQDYKSDKPAMQAPARIYGTKKLIDSMDLMVYEQISNVACLPGIQKAAMCMPDGHWGYGFPIGGVAAFDIEKGIISPGGIGYDINCGMRLIKTNLTLKDVQPKIKELVNTLYKRVPAGVGQTSFAEKEGILKLNKQQFKEVVEQGADWVVKQGYGWKKDLEHIESHGHMDGADSSKISDKAVSRGIHQVGTLGSGNHYLEIQHITKENIFDEKIAKKFGLFPGQIVIMFHCGSRGFGHQIATDYISDFMKVMTPKYGIEVRDRELVCVPFKSKEGQDYFKAMQCAVNMAFANRQMILHEIRKSFENVFGMEAEKMGLDLIYDVAHNIAKVEEHKVDGKKKELVVHRKGATRCFGPERRELAPIFRETGQPVIVGGSMETGSYLCVGTEKAEETWGSTMHGSGRTMSRGAARKQIWGEKLQQDMEKKGIYVKSVSMSGLSEEAGFAYKDINEVVETMDQAGISKKVVHLLPIGNVKG